MGPLKTDAKLHQSAPPPITLAEAHERQREAAAAIKDAETIIQRINAKREQIHELRKQVAIATARLEQAEGVHANHVERMAAYDAETIAVYCRNDPRGEITRNTYSTRDGLRLALEDWPRVKSHFRGEVDDAQRALDALTAEVEALVEGTRKTVERLPDFYATGPGPAWAAKSPDPDR